MRFLLTALLLLECLIVADACRAAQTVAVPAVSVESGAADCHEPGVSADGRFMVFVSRADNLVPNDHNGAFDVFVRDRALGKTILVSLNSAGTGSGNGPSVAASISANGRFVAFESLASDLVANDANNVSDIFLRDLMAGTTTLVSLSTNGLSSGNQASSWPVQTPDARFILFESRASDLATNDLNRAADLYVRDRVSGVTTLVTRDRFGSGSALGGGPVFADTARISDDGSWVAFTSGATNLVAGDNNQKTDVFVRDLLNRTNILVSVSTNGIPANNNSSNPTMSADGRYVAFQSLAYNLVVNKVLVTTNVYLRDLASRTTVLVSANQAGAFNATNSSFSPVISADGRYVAFQSMANDLVADDNLPNNYVPALDVFVRDLQSGTTTLASFHSGQTNTVSAYYTNWTKATDERSALPISISRDGRFVLFQSDGVEETITNGGGSNYTALTTILPGGYVFDQTTGTRTRISGGTFPALSEEGQVMAFQAAARDQLTGDAMSQLTPGSISANGRFLAFESFAANLVANDTNGTRDVFVRDLITGTNEWISANYYTDINNPGGTSFSNVLVSLAPSRLPSISGDGKRVAFEAVVRLELGTNGLNPQLTNGLNNRFTLCVYDRIERTNWFIASVGLTNKPSAPATPVWNRDGRYLAFRSSSGYNLDGTPIPNGSRGQVYFRDLTQDTNVLVSRNLDPLIVTGGSKPSWNPLISADGARVFFLRPATDLVTNAVFGTNLFVWDAASGSRSLLSISTDGGGLGGVNQAVLSSDGRFAVFLNRTNLYFCDLTLSTLSLMVSNASTAAMSADGRFVAFDSSDALAGNDTNLVSDIFVYDRVSNTVVLASVNLDGTASGNGRSTSPLVGPDGRYVVFTSQASDLVANDTNGFTDVFLRDLATRTTMLLSANFTGSGSGNRLSANPVLSADGNSVVFESYSSDITAGDFSGNKDIFVARLSVGDSDGDGMADDWEVAYFGDLSRDGSGDFDGDGQSDFAEYRAGTDPTDNHSVFRALTLSRPDLADGVMVLWIAVPGLTYRVQYKDGLEEADWSDLPGDIVATSATGAKLDSTIQIAASRFYRVKAVP